MGLLKRFLGSLRKYVCIYDLMLPWPWSMVVLLRRRLTSQRKWSVDAIKPCADAAFACRFDVARSCLLSE
jgi:hypothetical protein